MFLLVLAHLGSPRQRAIKGLCVCVCLFTSVLAMKMNSGHASSWDLLGGSRNVLVQLVIFPGYCRFFEFFFSALTLLVGHLYCTKDLL